MDRRGSFAWLWRTVPSGPPPDTVGRAHRRDTGSGISRPSGRKRDAWEDSGSHPRRDEVGVHGLVRLPSSRLLSLCPPSLQALYNPQKLSKAPLISSWQVSFPKWTFYLP